MNPSITLRSIAALAMITWAGSALAHEGRGLLASHAHAADNLGVIAIGAAIAVLAVAALWLSQKK